MKLKALIFIAIVTFFMAFGSNAKELVKAGSFNMGKDLLLVQFDCKTDVDDLQTAAALVTLLSDSRFSKINYHAVAGTYGIQEGLYVPPNPLFQLAFDDNWTDAHKNWEAAVEKVSSIIKTTLANHGDVWIADAGQSDFTAGLIKAIQSDLPEISVPRRIHVVQHSDWNEKVTSPENLEFVKKNADYHKIPDGNAVGNGTPGFRSPEYSQWKSKIRNPELTEIWQLAVDISNEYNGKEGRYNNEAISAGGLDFSDLAEVCWILGLQDIKDTEHFFNLSCIKGKSKADYTKPRIINTTDLGADPDDEQSMVRQLVSSNEFDIEGLIVSTGCWKKNQSNTGMLDTIISAYGEVYPNLTVHADGYPTPEYLKSVSVLGQTGYGMGDVGTGKNSPGSELIIASVDKDDPRPVWVMGWGGMNNVAQAIWKVRENRSEEELAKFLSKLRLFDILGQDDAGAWIAKNFPDVFYIRATSVYGWQPSDEYLDRYIQDHGPLGAVYPDTKWATEGDTPAFMHVYPNGLNDPEQIDQGGWGGRFSFTEKEGIRSMSEVHKIEEEAESKYDPYYMYGNTEEGAQAIKRWSEGYNNDFAARMDWSITGNYEDANHHPVSVLNGDKTRQVLNITPTAGSIVRLSAEGSFDPDGDSLIYSWSFYEEPGSYEGTVTIQNSSSPEAKLEIPKDAGGKTIHIILEIHDNGTPNLYAYRRMIINVQRLTVH